MWLLFILVLLFILLFWLPIRIEIDTAHEQYRFSWKGIFSLWGVPDETRWKWFFQVFFWKSEWKWFDKTTETTRKTRGKEVVKRHKRASFSMHKIRPLFRALSKSISIKRLRINWDTGDFVRNAWLYPAFRRLSSGQRQLFINFLGEQELAIILQTRLGLLLIAGLRVVFILKK